MLRGGAHFGRGRRWGALVLAAAVAVTAFSTEADARKRKKVARYNPPAASIVVDVNSGKVLQASNADSTRYPASLTKMMTLYMLFERLEAGSIKLSSELEVSAHAAGQPPSKLGLKRGRTIKVEDAIKVLITKSANDIAVVVAEALGGNEPAFARMMTAKARELGMNNTTYFNASGLPDSRQITTARDQSILGRALQDRFPKYYGYFATRSATIAGKTLRNHNRLLGNVTGVDGIKTGFIRASGFNIVTSAKRGNRHIVAVVIGGNSGKARDARARSLVENNINVASVKRTSPMVVEGWTTRIAGAPPTPIKDPRESTAKVETAAVAAKVETAELAAKVEKREAAEDAPTLGSTAPIKPVQVKTVTVEPGSFHVASLSPLPSNSRRLEPAPAATAGVTTVATVRRSEPPPPAKVASVGGAVPIPAANPSPAARPPGGWMIQVGAFDQESEAKKRLEAAQTKANELAKAEPYTEKIAKGEKALYRARFAGLDKGQAETACKSLRRNEIPCLLLRN